MGLDKWTAIGIVAGSITAVLLLAAIVVRGIRRVFRTARNAVWKLDKLADDLLGDRKKGAPSIVERVESVNQKLDEHLTWHAPPANGRSRSSQGW